MDGQRFAPAGVFDVNSLGMEVQLDMMTTIRDRYFSIAYSIANFIHHKGDGLLIEIEEECSKWAMIRKKYIDVVMGLV